MRKFFVLLSLSLLTTTACTPEMLKTILEDVPSESTSTQPDSAGLQDDSTSSSAPNSAVSSPSNSSTSANTDTSYPDTSAPASGYAPGYGTPVNSEPGYSDPGYSPPSTGDDESPPDGFDPALEGSLDGTTTNQGYNSIFDPFIYPPEVYFGPSEGAANLVSGLTGNDAAGSRFGGPNDVVGAMVYTVDSTAYMKVVNLNNQNEYNLVRADGSAFSVPVDILNSRPFASLFVVSIPSLTQIVFEHRTKPSPPTCTRYQADFQGTVDDGSYVAKVISTGSSCTYY